MAEQPMPGSPEWWRDRLLVKLDEQVKRLELLERYHDGRHCLPEPPRGMNEAVFQETKAAFLNLSKLGVTNLMPLVARAPADRLRVRGFRFGEDVAMDPVEAAKVPWRIWQRNHMDADHRLLIDTALVCANAYLMVWPDSDGRAQITVEHPSEVIIAYEPGSRRRRRAALKRWCDDDGLVNVNVYLPDGIYKYQTRTSFAGGLIMPSGWTASSSWAPRIVPGEEWPLPNKAGKVLVYEVAVNTGLRPRPYGGGVGEFEGVINDQDRLNKGVFDRLSTQEAQAYRQRYAIGWTPPIDPVTKQPDPRLVAQMGRSRMATFPKDVTVGEFGQADFTGFFESFKLDAATIFARSFTPQSMLPLDLKNIGSDTITLTNMQFYAKTGRHRDGITEVLEEVISDCLRIEDQNALADDVQSQVLWDQIEVRSLGEIADAVGKLGTAVPPEFLLELLPWVSQQDINRWAVNATAREMIAATAVPPALPATTGAPSAGA